MVAEFCLARLFVYPANSHQLMCRAHIHTIGHQCCIHPTFVNFVAMPEAQWVKFVHILNSKSAPAQLDAIEPQVLLMI